MYPLERDFIILIHWNVYNLFITIYMIFCLGLKCLKSFMNCIYVFTLRTLICWSGLVTICQKLCTLILLQCLINKPVLYLAYFYICSILSSIILEKNILEKKEIEFKIFVLNSDKSLKIYFLDTYHDNSCLMPTF